MAKISVETALLKAKSHAKRGENDEAEKLYRAILENFPKNKKAQKGLNSLNKSIQTNTSQNPPQDTMNQIVNLYNQGQLSTVVEWAQKLINQYPSAFDLWNIFGVSAAQIGNIDAATLAFRKVTKLNPSYPDGYNNLGNVLHEQGKLEEAQVAYYKALSLKPNYAEAFNNLGVVLHDQGKLDEAVEAYKNAITQKPDYSEAYHNLGINLHHKGELDDAIEAYNNAILTKPNYADVYFHMAATLREKGKLEEAIAACKKSLSLKPDSSDAYNYMGIILHDQGKLDKALEVYEKAISLNPDYAEAYNNIGNLFKDQDKLDEAIKAYKNAVSYKPNYADAYNNMGSALRDKRKLEEAIEAYKAALSFQPNHAETFNNMGNALHDQGKLDEAVEVYERAIAIKPNYAEAFFHMGLALQHRGSSEQAIKAFDKSIALKPNYAEAYHNKGRLLWQLFNFTEAFHLLEWRWKTKHKIGDQLITNKPVHEKNYDENTFLWQEQGVGDQIMYCSILPEIYSKCNKLIVSCDSRLIPLFKRSFPNDVKFVASNDNISESEYDNHVPMGSLPKIYRRDLASFKNAAKPFLLADQEKTKALRTKVKGDKTDLIIGLSWHTISNVQNSELRNVNLMDIAKLFCNLKVKLLSLQYGEVANEINLVKRKQNIEIFDCTEIDKFRDIDGLAALISACDLVVSIDNFTVHLASSLGVDTKMLTPFIADPRWGLNGDKSYWYESLSLYRQYEKGDWSQPLTNLRNAIISEYSYIL